jgi:hypothetical protein
MTHRGMAEGGKWSVMKAYKVMKGNVNPRTGHEGPEV